MKILHIIYDDINNPWCGGGGALRVLKVNEYIAQKNRVTVLTGNYPGAKNEIIRGIQFIRVGFASSYMLSRLSFTFLIPFYLKRFKSDLVVNECSFFSPCFADLYTHQPVINVIHHLMGNHSFKLYPVFGVYPYIIEKIFLKTVKNVITSAHGIREEIQCRKQLRNIVNIPNGVQNDLFDLESEENKFILFLGRIDIYMKGLDVLVDAFAKIQNPDIVLKIAGSGKTGDVKRLHLLIEKRELKKKVEILGKVTEKEKRDLMRTCLFLVMPSRFEGWGITAVEANATGKPVIGTKIKGLSEAIVDKETALLVTPSDVNSLLESVELLISDHDKRALLGKQGRKWAKNFSWDIISNEQFSFYQTVLMNR